MAQESCKDQLHACKVPVGPTKFHAGPTQPTQLMQKETKLQKRMSSW